MTKRKIFDYWLLAFAVIAFGIVFYFTPLGSAGGNVLTTPRPAPEFTEQGGEAWINSKPLSLDDLRGKVVLIDFWTFGCWNCYRSFPWLNSLEEEYEDKGLQVIGVHTPEFDHEKKRDAIEKKVAEFELEHPVMIDNDFEYWRAMDNRYWPTYYILDKQGRVRAWFAGETHKGDRNARKIEEMVQELLAEKVEVAEN